MQRVHKILAALLVTGAVVAWVSRSTELPKPVTVIAVLGPILIAFGWLIFARSKFSIGQLLFSLFVYGGILGGITNIHDLSQERQISLSISSALSVILCMFFGARSAAKANPCSRARQWRFFMAGFLFLPSGLLALVLLIGTLIRPGAWSIYVGVPIWAIALFSVTTVIECIGLPAPEQDFER